MIEHPALGVVLWEYDHALKSEWSEYRGRSLRILHVGEFPNNFCLGYVEGKFAGSRDNVPKICDLLFRAVDAAEDAK